MSVFKFASRSKDTIVLEVVTDDLLTIAQNPYISSTYKYISLSKQTSSYDEHDFTLTVINKDGRSWGFSWGFHGYTLISNRLELLQAKVLEFITGTQCPGQNLARYFYDEEVVS